MEKIELVIKSPKNTRFEFQENEIEMRPLMTLPEQIVFMGNYIEQYFTPAADVNSTPQSTYDYIGAEFSLIAGIIDQLTNVQVSDSNMVYCSGLWGEVQKRIQNYPQFRRDLDRVVSDIKEQKTLQTSVGYMLDGIYAQVTGFLKTASELDEEKIKAMQEALAKLVEETRNGPLAGLLTEAQKPPLSPAKKTAQRKKKVE